MSDTEKPSLVTWFVATLSTCFCLGVIYLGQQISTGYHYATLYQAFNSYFAKETDLTQILSKPEFTKLFTAEEKMVKNLKPLLSLISQKDIAKASAYAKKQTWPNSPLYSQLTESLGTLEKVRSEQVSKKKLLEEAELAESNNIQSYSRLRAEFKTFLGDPVNPKPDLQPQDEPNCVFYNKGIFTGLPQVSTLPNDISDLKHLAQTFSLSKQGQRPPTSEMVTRTIERLKTLAQPLEFSCKDLSQKRNEAAEQQEEYLKATEVKLRTSETALKKVIANLAEPDLDEKTLSAYQMFKGSAEKLGYHLPELS